MRVFLKRAMDVNRERIDLCAAPKIGLLSRPIASSRSGAKNFPREGMELPTGA